MSSTVLFIVVLATMFLITLALWVSFLAIGLRWAKAEDLTRKKFVLATSLNIVMQIFLLLDVTRVINLLGDSIVATVVDLAMMVIAPCAIISWVFRISLGRAFQAWLPTLLSSVISVLLLLFLVRPFLYETYLVPTNAMAPTLLGEHWRGVCPECQEPSYSSPARPSPFGGPDFNPTHMICERFHITGDPQSVDGKVYPGDRIAVDRLSSPQRWDLLVFRYPDQPTMTFVMRLVGLPGEEIVIKDGSAWANGKRLTPPSSIRGIGYATDDPVGPWWGSSEEPAILGEDEFFVLGDFTSQSRDSRFWDVESGAVPKSAIVGVVSHTYWPPQRWRAHR